MSTLNEGAGMDTSTGEQPMTSPSYGNFCGLARAFEIIGAPWSGLIVRDLLLGPKGFAELGEALRRAAPDELRTRLSELTAAGVITHSGTDPVYELTSYGRDLEPVLSGLALWGARSLGDPRQGDIVTIDMAILALRTTFRADRAIGVRATYEVWFGPMVVNVRIDDGDLTVAEGELPDADLVISSPVLKHLMAAELSPTDALWLGLAETKGDPSLLNTFVQLFHIPPPPRLPTLPTVPTAEAKAFS